jgi:hypothetical protein
MTVTAAYEHTYQFVSYTEQLISQKIFSEYLNHWNVHYEVMVHKNQTSLFWKFLPLHRMTRRQNHVIMISLSVTAFVL